MLAKALKLAVQNPKALLWHVKIKLLRGLCWLFSGSGFYLQGRMDIDSKSWWHNADFAAKSGGYFVPGDTMKRVVLALEPWDTTRRDMIILLLRNLVERRVEGDLAELGVFRGSTARLIHHYLPERKLYLFDTFAGFDERDVRIENKQTGLKTKSAEFAETSVEMTRRNIAPQNDNVQFFPGYFPQSVPAFLNQRTFALVHLDADLYEPMLAALNFFYDKMAPGGIILAHDFNSWPGARLAVQDFFKDKPEMPVPMPDKSGSVLIVKLKP